MAFLQRRELAIKIGHPQPNRFGRRLGWVGLLFAVPALIYFAWWIIGPMFYGIWISFTNENWFSRPQFVGLANFTAMFQSPEFWHTLERTGLYLIETVIPGLLLAFVIAWIINQLRRGRMIFLAAFFIPFVVPTVASAIVFEMLLQPSGIIDQFFHLRVNWLTNPHYALLGLSIVTIWNLVGFYIIIFLAGLQQVNPEVLEASTVDGANTWQTLSRIVVPLMRPTILFAMVTSTATILTNFTQPYVLTNGGPGHSTLVLPLLIYQEAFTYSSGGEASAMALALLVASVILTYFQFKVVRQK